MSLSDNYKEALYYSTEQENITKEQGDMVGVILLDGQSQPMLWTETCTNRVCRSRAEEFFMMGQKTDPSELLKSNFEDAVTLYLGRIGEGYKILVGGNNTVTEEGITYCNANGLEITPNALRAISKIPTASDSVPHDETFTLS